MHGNIHAKLVVTSSAERMKELGTMSKNNFRGITFRIGSIWRANFLTLHALYSQLLRQKKKTHTLQLQNVVKIKKGTPRINL